MGKRYAGKVWKCLPILEENRLNYEKYLFELICDMSAEQVLTKTESAVLKKLKGLREVNEIAHLTEIKSVILHCSSLLYKDGE